MGQQLSRYADTFASTAWTGSGFGADAELEVSVEFRRIVAGLTQTASIKSLDFQPTSRGIVGGPDDGALTLNANSDENSRVRILGRVDAWLAAQTKVENLHLGHPGARARLQTGEFETTSISAGKLTATEAVVIDEFYGLGGTAKIPYGASAGSLDFAKLTGGSRLHLGRGADLIIVGEGAELDLDPDSSVTWTDAQILVLGGLVRWWGGVLPNISGIGGVIDFRVARGPISGLGADSFELVGTKVYESPLVDLSNATTPPAIARTNSGAVQYGGGPIPLD